MVFSARGQGVGCGAVGFERRRRTRTTLYVTVIMREAPTPMQTPTRRHGKPEGAAEDDDVNVILTESNSESSTGTELATSNSS